MCVLETPTLPLAGLREVAPPCANGTRGVQKLPGLVTPGVGSHPLLGSYSLPPSEPHDPHLLALPWPPDVGQEGAEQFSGTRPPGSNPTLPLIGCVSLGRVSWLPLSGPQRPPPVK